MSAYVNLNGQLISENKAQISIHDQAYLFGYGLFETIRVYQGKLPFFKQHMARFHRGMRALKIKSPFTDQEILKLIERTLKKNQLKDASVRLILSPLAQNIQGAKSNQCNFLVLARALPDFPKEYYDKGIKTWIIDEIKVHHDHLSLIKITSYARLQYARELARRKKVFEVILKDNQGHPVECSSSSLFMVDNKGQVIAPPLSSGILPGVTRDTVFHICKKAKIKIIEKSFSQNELLNAPEAFISSSLKGIMPIKSIQGRTIPSPGTITSKIMNTFFEII